MVFTFLAAETQRVQSRQGIFVRRNLRTTTTSYSTYELEGATVLPDQNALPVSTVPELDFLGATIPDLDQAADMRCR